MSRLISRTLATIATTVLLILGGCHEAAMSDRETPGDFNALLSSLYTSPPTSGVVLPAPLYLPANIAVAQLGEVAPPESMLEKLRSDPDVVRSAVPLPWLFARSAQAPANPQQQQQAIALELQQMQQAARDQGLDYLFVFGGTTTYGQESNPLSVLDLTIVGGFVLPGKSVKATARTSGALLNVHSGRVILSVSTDAQNGSLVPSFGSDGAERQALLKVRAKASDQLADRFLEAAPRRAALPTAQPQATR